MRETLELFAATPKGMESLLADELTSLGAEHLTRVRAGVEFSGTLETAYRVCLWSRLANRLLMPITRFMAKTPDELYAGIQQIDWATHLPADGTLAVDFNITRSRIKHSQFAALKVKDAIVDQFREKFGKRPGVDTERPDLRINVYLVKNEARVSLDLSGESLHRRGYRVEGGAAPMKENLASAILIRAGWPAISAKGGHLIDPMCGSGTLLIEAALMAADIAPGLLRRYFGFLGWLGHDAALWQSLCEEAQQRREQGISNMPRIQGSDINAKAVALAKGNVKRAGLENYIGIVHEKMQDAEPTGPFPGLLLTNPPYGERMGGRDDLHLLYRQLGQVINTRFAAWQVGIFTCTPHLMRDIGLYAAKNFVLYNGALECQLFVYYPHGESTVGTGAAPSVTSVLNGAGDLGGAPMLANRLRKNLKHLGKWAKRNDISCYRLYDADLPEYALAIDLYQAEKTWVHVQEYQAPSSIDPVKAADRLRDALVTIRQVLEIPSEQLFFKQRRRQKGAAQYEKYDQRGEFHTVREGDARCRVNFSDYLDTGLFLDHRVTRDMIRNMAKGKRFLNLFAYTGVATVQAALGGATSTTTVDMSATYLDWAERNMKLNRFSGSEHRFVQANCIEWIKEQRSDSRARYDLIFLDPPTFSTSKRMDKTFDVQRDHVELLRDTARLLSPDGVLVFSNNFQKFKMDYDALAELDIRDITKQTIPEDFARHPKIHSCWLISRKNT